MLCAKNSLSSGEGWPPACFSPEQITHLRKPGHSKYNKQQPSVRCGLASGTVFSWEYCAIIWKKRAIRAVLFLEKHTSGNALTSCAKKAHQCGVGWPPAIFFCEKHTLRSPLTSCRKSVIRAVWAGLRHLFSRRTRTSRNIMQLHVESAVRAVRACLRRLFSPQKHPHPEIC